MLTTGLLSLFVDFSHPESRSLFSALSHPAFLKPYHGIHVSLQCIPTILVLILPVERSQTEVDFRLYETVGQIP